MEDSQSDSEETHDNNSSIEGWTKDEKFNLLQALKVSRSRDITRINQYVSTKTPEEIFMAINHYKKIASKHPVFQKKITQPKKVGKPRVPLASWAKMLTDNVSLDDLKTEISTAIRMIAELENIPEPLWTEGVDFRGVYHTIANAMEGKAIVPEKVIVAVLNKCIVETAMASKAFIKTSSYKHLMNSISLNTTETLNTFNKPTKNQELAVLRYLAAQTSYNPLRVPENHMKPSYEVMDAGPTIMPGAYGVKP